MHCLVARPCFALAPLVLAAACATGRPTGDRVVIPSPVPSDLAVLASHAPALGLTPAEAARLEGAAQRLAEVTDLDRREVDEQLRPHQRPGEGGGARFQIGPAGFGSGGGGGEGGGTGPSEPPRGGMPGGGPSGGPSGGGGGGGGGGRRGGPGDRQMARVAALEEAGRRVSAALGRIEDAELAAYLAAEAWLPAAIHDRCRELVSTQREALLARHEAIRARLGVAE